MDSYDSLVANCPECGKEIEFRIDKVPFAIPAISCDVCKSCGKRITLYAEQIKYVKMSVH